MIAVTELTWSGLVPGAGSLVSGDGCFHRLALR